MASYLQEINVFLLTLDWHYQYAIIFRKWLLLVDMCSYVLSRPTLCDPVDYGQPGSSAHGLLCPWQEYWSGLPCPPGGDLPDSETEPASLMSPALAGGFFTTEPPEDTVATYEMEMVCRNQTLVPASVHVVKAV